MRRAKKRGSLSDGSRRYAEPEKGRVWNSGKRGSFRVNSVWAIIAMMGPVKYG
jgi:hypothetical protein